MGVKVVISAMNWTCVLHLLLLVNFGFALNLDNVDPEVNPQVIDSGTFLFKKAQEEGVHSLLRRAPDQKLVNALKMFANRPSYSNAFTYKGGSYISGNPGLTTAQGIYSTFG